MSKKVALNFNMFYLQYKKILLRNQYNLIPNKTKHKKQSFVSQETLSKTYVLYCLLKCD